MSKQKKSNVVETENQKGENEMKNLETQNHSNPSYPCVDGKISEELAIKKLMLLANNFLKVSEATKNENFKVTIGYMALNKLLYSKAINKARRLNELDNEFIEINDEYIEDIGYCLDVILCENAQLYCATNNGKNINSEILCKIEEMEEIDQINFQELFQEKINLLDLMIKEPSFKEDYTNGDLIYCYFKFNVHYEQNNEISNNSTVKAIFHIFDESDKDFPEIKTYRWLYDLKSFLKSQEEPELKVLFTSVAELYETDFSDL